jgi:leucyl/phenylalanyl-tRNA---protein transferase
MAFLHSSHSVMGTPYLKYVHIPFPDPEQTGQQGLVAIGGELSTDMLISAYAQGIFPWFSETDPIMWWSPDPRMVLLPKGLKVSKSLRAAIKNKDFYVRFDTQFEKVIQSCAEVKREGQQGTWITDEMIGAYTILHNMGIAHSVEVYQKGSLVGGLYGIALGKVFFGESMFHLKRDASKIALFYLCNYLVNNDYILIDAQQSTPHLASLGATTLARRSFLALLKKAVTLPSEYAKWH